MRSDSGFVFFTPGVAEGHRKCTIRNCHTIIPPEHEYKWKMCVECRRRTRLGARKRKYGTTGETSSEEEDVPLALRKKQKDAAAVAANANAGDSPVKYKKLKLMFQGVPVVSLDAYPVQPALPVASHIVSAPAVLVSQVCFHYHTFTDMGSFSP